MSLSTDTPRRKWWQISWFAVDDTEEEKRFLKKLDLILIPYLFLTFLFKSLDGANLSKSSSYGSLDSGRSSANVVTQMRLMSEA